MTERILCLGEALIDAVERDGQPPVEHIGGSILNVAIGLSQLGHRASLRSWWGKDARGERIAAAVREADVEIEPGSDGADFTTVTHAKLDDAGKASYTFDVQWAVPPLTDLDSVAHIHTGCFSATMEPGGSVVVETMRQVRDNGTVSYDPNVRPSLMGTPEQVVPRVEELVALSDVVKASDEDLEWLYPDTPVEDVMRRWLKLGPSVMVTTRGPWGAYAMIRHSRNMLVVDPVNVSVSDTVGAGDSFMAGLISGLVHAGLLGSTGARERLLDADWSDIQPALHRAVMTSAITVSKDGAYGPTMDEIRSVQAIDPTLAD